MYDPATDLPSIEASRLEERMEEAMRLFPQDAALVEGLGRLRERLAAGRFHLAILGQFKRGKSTLLNALLGESILPTAVVPLTAIPTFIRSGPVRRAEIRFRDARPPVVFSDDDPAGMATFLSHYVTEADNPKNRLEVASVELAHPAPVLAQGLVMVDTPGIGSTYRHNTEATLAFLSQCDAAFFLLSADPPITEVEVEFLGRIREKVPRLFFILNKVDYLNAEERRSVLAFLKDVLADRAGVDASESIICVSARKALQAILRGDEDGLAASGLGEIRERLLQFLVREKSGVLQSAIALKAGDLLEDAILRLRLTIRSLELPIEDLERRLALFQQRIAEIQRQRVLAGDQLAGERKRLHARLEDETEDLRRRARRYLRDIVQEAIHRAGDASVTEAFLQEDLAGAIPAFFDQEQGRALDGFTRHVESALEPHRQQAETLIDAVRKTAADLFEIPHRAPEASGAFVLTRDPYWVSRSWTDSLSPLPPGLLDRMLSRRLRLRRIRQRIHGQLDLLVIRNAENLRWSLYQSLDQALSRFADDLDQRLATVVASTYGAVATARDRMKSRQNAISSDIEIHTTTLAKAEEIAQWIRDIACPGARP